MRKIAVIVVSLIATGALAQPVWRCGNTYGSVPCEGGTVVGRPAPVSAGESAQSQALAKSDAKLAAALEQERLQQEKAAPKAVIPPVPVAAASAPAKKETGKGKKKEPEHLTAVLPAPKKPRK